MTASAVFATFVVVGVGRRLSARKAAWAATGRPGRQRRRQGRANQNTTGQFHDDYTKVLADVVTPNAAAQKTTTRVEVNDAAVVSATKNKVVVLVFLAQTTTSAGSGLSLSGSRVEVTLKAVGDRWLISGLMPL